MSRRKNRQKPTIPNESSPVEKKAFVDGLYNLMTGLGTERDKNEYNIWQYGLLDNWQQLDACYQENWIARRIVDVPAEDMTREWRTIKSSDAEEIQRVEDFLTIPSFTQESVSWANLYGGAGMLMITNQDWSKPLEVDKIKKGDLQRVIVFNRWEMGGQTLNTEDVTADNYLRPEYYTIRGGKQTIHYTHFALFYGEQLPRWQLAQTQGWGDSVLRKCLKSLTNLQAAVAGISNLMQKANLDVFKIAGLKAAMASDQDEAVKKRQIALALGQSNFGASVVDSEEAIERLTLSLGGVAQALEMLYTYVAGSANIPLTKLFGTSAKGMNATGEGDMRNYYDTTAAKQNRLRVPLRTLDEVLVRSAIGYMPDDFDYIWNPLQKPNGVEVAQAQLLEAQKHQAYLGMNAIQVSQIQSELRSSEQYQFEDEDIEELKEFERGSMFNEPVSQSPEETEEPEADPLNV